GKPPLTTGVRRKKAATMSEWVALLTGFLIEGWISVSASAPFLSYSVDALALICPLLDISLNFDRLCPF
ncbi:MAG: hypothetical protein ACRESZ_06125, partial [Methylococcales bacterium]